MLHAAASDELATDGGRYTLSLADFLSWVRSVLRDDALQGIGAIFAILVVIVPWISRRLKSNPYTTLFRRMFWWLSVPILSALTVVIAIRQKVELVVIFSVAIAILYLVRQRETSVDQAKLEEECKRKLIEARRDKSGSAGVSPYEVIKGPRKS
jgi:predicted cobalt transporter CbtA